jgi:predicted aldo/keto reductase-like oxidoreductase
MQYYTLGKTGLLVSNLCFGSLPMGPLQANLPVEEGGQLLLDGLNQGVNFIDTAEIYQTYPHVKWALKRFTGNLVVASKSITSTYQGMKDSIEKSLNELERNQIEIFHLHASRDNNPPANRGEALEALLEAKRKGLIKAIGVASHSVLGVECSARDPRIDIIFSLINRTGLGIIDGGVPEMVQAIQQVKVSGQGLYAMKALGGGTMLQEIRSNIDYVRKTVEIPVVAVGMIRRVELEMNLAIFEDRPVSGEIEAEAGKYRKSAKVTFLCKGCGQCARLCHNDAITIVNGKAVIEAGKCLLCGYCSRECPQFAIRVI